MLEVLISTALGTIVLAGVFDLYVSSSNSILGQTNEVQMQTNAKAAMDYMTRALKNAYYLPNNIPPSPNITTTTTAGDTIGFIGIEDAGYSSGVGNTSTLFNDSSKSWTAGGFASGAYYVSIINGQGVGEGPFQILSNTVSSLTVAAPGWASIPNNNSLYYITRAQAFRRQADNTLRYQTKNGSFNLLSANVTSLAFSQPDPQSVAITLTAQTQTVDPRTGKPASYTLSDTVRKRN